MAAGHVKVGVTRAQVSKTPSWHRSWANIRLCTLIAGFPQECPGQLASFWASLTPLSLQFVAWYEGTLCEKIVSSPLDSLHCTMRGCYLRGSWGPLGPLGFGLLGLATV